MSLLQHGVPLQWLVTTTFLTLKLQPLPNNSPTSPGTGLCLSFWQAHRNWQKAMLKNASVGSFPHPFSLPQSSSLSAQAGSGRTEMAFWVTQAGYAICRVNRWKRIEKEVETNDDGLIVLCLLLLSPSTSPPSRSLSPNNVATMPVRVERFIMVLWMFFLFICIITLSHFVFLLLWFYPLIESCCAT